MYFNQFVSLSLKKKIKLHKKNLPFTVRGKKKKAKSIDLEISSKCQAAWSSKHKYQGSFLIVGTKWPRPTQSLRSSLKYVLEVQRTGEQVDVYSCIHPQKWPYIGRVQKFCMRLLNLSKDSIPATKILSKMHKHFLFIYKRKTTIKYSLCSYWNQFFKRNLTKDLSHFRKEAFYYIVKNSNKYMEGKR